MSDHYSTTTVPLVNNIIKIKNIQIPIFTSKLYLSETELLSFKNDLHNIIQKGDLPVSNISSVINKKT